MVRDEEPDRTSSGSGSYSHVVKERLMGMYLSVYVYRGCEHLVQGKASHEHLQDMRLTRTGIDKDIVTAGLAGGRLGNKGGM